MQIKHFFNRDSFENFLLWIHFTNSNSNGSCTFHFQNCVQQPFTPSFPSKMVIVNNISFSLYKYNFVREKLFCLTAQCIVFFINVLFWKTYTWTENIFTVDRRCLRVVGSWHDNTPIRQETLSYVYYCDQLIDHNN